MEHVPATISYSRLFEAAEAVAGVVRDAVGPAGGWVNARDTLNLRNLQARLPEFSAEECFEGARFLIRLGFLEIRE